jgi:hypothetical protein
MLCTATLQPRRVNVQLVSARSSRPNCRPSTRRTLAPRQPASQPASPLLLPLTPRTMFRRKASNGGPSKEDVQAEAARMAGGFVADAAKKPYSKLLLCIVIDLIG